MSIQLQNNDLNVIISNKGAELSSVKSLKYELEYLWQGDSSYWSRKAPILFPIVGRLINDQYEFNGNKYNLGQHGFARDYNFKTNKLDDTMVSLFLESDESTKKMYPFDFRLTITYVLDKNSIIITYLVENLGNEMMYFSIGAHPGFNLPLVSNTVFEDYYISFTPNYARETIPLIGPYLDLTSKTITELDRLALSRDIFDNDALIYGTCGKNTLTIQSDKTNRFISLSYNDFPYVGIWSPPKKAAPFVCLEPWLGIADPINASGNINEKLGIIQLEGGKSFAAEYSITFG